ncbi:hypothetical protein [Fictibacillus enclensis]|nr:hypothetical protein [Fictibacillus enclensis]
MNTSDPSRYVIARHELLAADRYRRTMNVSFFDYTTFVQWGKFTF